MKLLAALDNHFRIADRKVRLLSRINPRNANREFQRFMTNYCKGETYNPCFAYKPVQTNLGQVVEDLKAIRIPIPPDKNERWFFARHLENKRKRIIAKIEAVEARGNPAFIGYASHLYGHPSRRQAAFARRALRKKHVGKVFSALADTLSCYEASSVLTKYLYKRGLPWRVKTRRSIASKAGLDARSKYLLVKTGEKFAPEEILSLAVHEIETHIYRRENGMRQKLPGLFGEGFAGPPTTEEGLAVFNEVAHNYDPRRLIIMCARTIAAHMARTQSFYRVFQHLIRHGIPLPYAWAITTRVKRGLSDTSKPGAFSKDHHYLKGYLEVKKFLANNGRIEQLYIGKLNISIVQSLRDLGIRTKKPKFLPHVYEN